MPPEMLSAPDGCVAATSAGNPFRASIKCTYDVLHQDQDQYGEASQYQQSKQEMLCHPVLRHACSMV